MTAAVQPGRTGADNAAGFPADAVLLPLTSGALLVSRAHAVFCRIPSAELAAVRAVIGGGLRVEALSAGLRADLERHGWFAPPRPPKADPPTVQLQLTNACNLACAYCCTNSGKPRAGEVSFERLRDVVRRIPEVAGADTRVALLGGEPLLVPWALDLATEILDRGLHVTLFSNGMPLVDDDLARRAAALTARGMEVRISLGGPSAELCDAVSGTRRFDLAIEGLQRFAAHGGRAAVDLMLMPESVGTVAQDLPRLRERLPPGTPVALGILYLSGRETGAHLFRGRAELEDALNRIAFEAGESIAATAPSPVTHRREGCGCALGRHVHIRSDGALFNCFKMEEKVGDLAGMGFDAAARFIREHPHRAADLPTCAACPLATLCGAGCRSENLLYTGDADVPPCGPWRVRVLSELLAEDRVSALEWPVAFLVEAARARGIATPPDIAARGISRHLVDV